MVFKCNKNYYVLTSDSSQKYIKVIEPVLVPAEKITFALWVGGKNQIAF